MSITKPSIAFAAAFAVLLTPALASALTLTNNSKEEQTVGIDMGAKETTLKIAAGKSATVEGCDAGCGVTGPWQYSMKLKTGDKWDFDGTSPVRSAK